MSNLLATVSPSEITPLVLQMSPAIEMTDEQFWFFRTYCAKLLEKCQET
ncbi:hypothetical protein [Floridanema evergladense]|uniref:Uncharacterized protein n=1 Tax=Floridaenema evergladense BLCC-F167 TaxID=3153639 RepID=A0ABV4WJ83_9CYAN